ncbi:MAG: flagellar basal-body MS-ring/collar protein FliF [Rhodospirillaceae bacterium]
MESLFNTFKSLGTVRLAAIGAVAVGLVLFFVFLTSRLGGNDMMLLYGDLDQSDSGKIVSKLETMNIPFELRGEGRQIYVPSQQVPRLRMHMAEDGLPSGGSVGYEIFDKSDSLGTTSFVQNVNLLRALEGELARTIRAISQIEEARVHLVMPKRELFSRQEQKPSASVVLKTRGAGQLSKAQILAIQHLVASAVPRLEPDRISIIDARGRLLARAGGEDDDGTAFATTSEELRRAHEERVTRRIEELVEQTVGFGKVRAQVAAELDFDRVTTNTEAYDPESQVVRSTQTVEENAQSSDNQGENNVTVANNLPDAQQNAAGGGNASLSNRTEETVNYEITRTVKNHVRETGVVRRISVALMVDGTYGTDNDGNRVYSERDAAELQKIEALVKSAIGYDESRGDKVEVVSMQFRTLDGDDMNAKLPLFGLTKSDLFRIAEIFVLAVVGILVILLVVRPLIARTLDALPSALDAAKEQALLADQSEDGLALSGPSGTGISGAFGEESNEDQLINLDQVDGRVKASTLKKISEIVDRHPEETVGIIRQWMYQES